MELAENCRLFSFNINNALDTAFAPPQETAVGTSWKQTKNNIGISSL